MMADSILVCGAGTHREFGLRSLLGAGLRVGVVEDPANVDASSAHAWLRCSAAVALDSQTLDDLLDEKWGAVVCWGEFALDVLPQILQRSGLPGPMLNVRQVRSKPAMRKILTAAGFPQPRYRFCRSLREALEFQAEVGGVMIVKPPRFAGSAGVRLVSDPKQTELARTDINRLGGSGMVCEEHLEGPEYSCEVLIVNGEDSVVYGVTEKFVTTVPLFFEVGHAYPAFIEAPTRQQLIDCAINAARALGVSTASVHAELKVVNGLPYVIEIAGRLAGDEIPQLVHLSTGANPFVLEAEVMLGRRPSIAAPKPTSSVRAVSVCLDGLPGSIMDLSGVRRLIAECDRFDLREFRAFIPERAMVPDAQEGRVRIGQIVGMTSMDRAELADFIQDVCAAL
jgi:biotin carboxylase